MILSEHVNEVSFSWSSAVGVGFASPVRECTAQLQATVGVSLVSLRVVLGVWLWCMDVVMM